MNEREKNKELIQQIAETLRGHTEPYREGAWERFAGIRAKPRRRVLWWPYWSTAAALLVAVGLFWYTRQPHTADMQPHVAQQDTRTPQEMLLEPETPAQGEESAAEVVGSATLLAHVPIPDERRTPVRETESRPLALAQEVVVQQEVADQSMHDTVTPYVAQDADPSIAVAAADTVPTADSTPQRLAAVADLSGTPARDANDQAYEAARYVESGLGKWDLGLVVSPSLTSEKINMGGGLAVAYRISDKFSIGSGVSISQLGLAENPDHQPRFDSRQSMMALEPGNAGFNGHSEEAIDYKREVSVTSSVVTLDIPLDLRYEVAKGFYTSVGVSYVAVLNEQRTSHFVDQLNKKTFDSGKLSGADRLASTEFTYSSEKVAAQPLRGNEYAGFMNFSIGKRLPISRRLSLSIEPYFKLPIGRLSHEEMDFTNGGIRIVTGF